MLARKTIKQTCMTRSYSVTRHGATRQIMGQLKKAGVDRKILGKASHYLSGITIEAAGEVCGASRDIMSWLREAVRGICKAYPDGEVMWKTPLGFPVVQPYRNYRTMQIRTALQNIRVAYGSLDVPIAMGKQVRGAPPNFIHSLDATHMFMTAITCFEEEIDFAAVHDCYWTHAEDMDRLNVILRDQFVLINEEPIIDNLYWYWREEYPEAKLPDPPAVGDFDISEVRSATYFFS